MKVRANPETADDNVATVLRTVSRGDLVRVRSGPRTLTITSAADVPLSHKIALAPIAAGEAVRKYGEVIGRASEPIAQGERAQAPRARRLVLPVPCGPSTSTRRSSA